MLALFTWSKKKIYWNTVWEKSVLSISVKYTGHYISLNSVARTYNVSQLSQTLSWYKEKTYRTFYTAGNHCTIWFEGLEQ